jgi:hypothetical protein
VSPGSQLAAIFSGKGGENIHIFYQDDNHAIQHVKYAEEEWQDSSEVPPKERSEESSEESRTESRTESPATLRAQQGSGLAVVSTGDPEDSDLRLYYQLGNDKIQELFTDSKHEWTACMFIVPYLPLATYLPFCAKARCPFRFQKTLLSARLYGRHLVSLISVSTPSPRTMTYSR